MILCKGKHLGSSDCGFAVYRSNIAFFPLVEVCVATVIAQMYSISEPGSSIPYAFESDSGCNSQFVRS